MNKLYQFCSERLYRKFDYDSDTIQNHELNFLTVYESSVAGFIPLKGFFVENKKGYFLITDPKLNYVVKLYILVKYIP